MSWCGRIPYRGNSHRLYRSAGRASVENNMEKWTVKIPIAALLVGGSIFAALSYGGFLNADKAVIELDNNAETVVDEATKKEDGAVQPEEAAGEISEEVPVEAPVKTGLPQEKESVIEKKPVEKTGSLKIVDRLVGFGYEKASGRDIDTIIVHSSYDALGSDPFSVSGIIKEYEMYGVAAHYLIARDGTAYRLVKDADIAYHAGAGKVPDGRTGVNGFSLGIELMNTKTGKFTDAQYEALEKLIGQIKNRHKIKYVLGHDQIAPGRKDDPWNFDWDRLD